MKMSSRTTGGVAILMAFLIFTIFIVVPYFNRKDPNTISVSSVVVVEGAIAAPVESVEITQSPLVQTHASVQALFRLRIPIIGVDAPLESLGLASDGTVAVPKGPVNAAWFNQGPRPGSIGSAVIVGHYGWNSRTPAVFDNLSKLVVGDTIYVQEEDGSSVTFVVRQTRTYGQLDIAPEIFYSSDGKAHLNLITCGGLWNKITKRYPDRIVVFTDKI